MYFFVTISSDVTAELPLILMSPKPAGEWRVFTYEQHLKRSHCGTSHLQTTLSEVSDV